MARHALKAIQDWNAGLLPDDRHDKYCDMSSSPFVFYRGSNHLFWADFADDKRLKRFSNKKTRTWLQGDMHADQVAKDYKVFKAALGPKDCPPPD